ncbi:MAG: hypothetical protein H6920_11350, partial [Sphingomonadaceae bacterium]|nr:hypothetical protein [Sphingomonadaceae bacterium]
MRLIDAANSIYEFGDPAFGFSAWSALRDKGREGTFTTLAWQGSIAATLAALQAAVAERGGGVVAPSIACAKWWTQPSGPLTADFIGSAGSGGSMQAAAIADALSQSVAGPAVAGLAAANALRPGTAGLHVGGENESFAQAIDRLLLGVSLLWLPRPDGTIAIREWAFNDAAPVLNGIFKGRSRTYPPHGKRRLGFQRNERIHNDSEIAGILLEEITDGDSLLAREDLLNSEQQWGDVQDQLGTRPEDNATNGAQAGVNITDESGELLSDVDIVTADDPKLQGIDEGARRDANMVPNGDLAEPGSEMFLFQTRTSRVKGVASDPVASFLRFDAGGNAQMWFGVGVSTNAGNSNAVIPINPGDKLFVRFLARKNAGSTAQLQWAFFVYDGAKNYGGGFNSGYFDFGSGWEYRTGVIEVPATGSNGNPVAYIKFQLKKVGATNQVDVAGAWLTKFERGATVGATAGTNLRQSGGQVLTDAEIRNTDLRVSAQPGGEFYLTRTGNVAIDNFNLSEAGIDALAYLPAVDLGTSQAVGTLPVERAAAELRNSELQLTKTGTTFNLAGGGASDALDIAALGFVGDLNATAGADFGANVAN